MVLAPGTADHAVVTVMPARGVGRAVPLPAAATAMTGDDNGQVYVATRGGYFRVDIAGGRADRVPVDGQDATEFTAIARRADGKLVLGSADGAVYTLSSDTAVGAELKIFARVDGLVAQGNTAVVLDRGQTSVTTVDPTGTKADHALRAGEGATTIAADSVGRVMVADTRGDGLLVFGTDPLMLRQRCSGARRALRARRVVTAGMGVTDRREFGCWLRSSNRNSRREGALPTVQQPNSLAFDEASGTLYVVSGTGAGVQVITNAEGAR